MVIGIITGGVLSACAGPSPVADKEAHAPAGLRIPGTYDGILPCRDCEMIRTTITLFEDGALWIRDLYVGVLNGGDDRSDRLGSWRLAEDGATLVLTDGSGLTRRFSLGAEGQLRPIGVPEALDPMPLSYQLEHSPESADHRKPFPINGTVDIREGRAYFTDCLSGRRFAIMEEGDFTEAEASFHSLDSTSESGVLMTFEGHLATRPGDPGAPEETVVVMDNLDGVWPEETCGEESSGGLLEGIHWTLTDLGGFPVSVIPGEKRPFILLDSQAFQMSGFGGCNRLFGSYESSGQSLRFGPVGSTRMTCTDVVDEMERAFLDALSATAVYRIEGDSLILLSDETPLARLTATSAP
jgi:heat shock protein HslJ